jgi:hypothetical protein
MCSAKKTLICAAWVDTHPCQPNVYVVSFAVYTSLLTVFPNTLKQLTTTSNSSGAERFSFSNLVRIFSGYDHSVSSPPLPTSLVNMNNSRHTRPTRTLVCICVWVYTHCKSYTLYTTNMCGSSKHTRDTHIVGQVGLVKVPQVLDKMVSQFAKLWTLPGQWCILV